MPSGIRRRRAAKQKVTTKKARRSEKRGHSKQVYGSQVIAENWNTDLTLRQNYKKLGLASNLQALAGGVEKDKEEPIIKQSTVKTAKIVTDDDGNTRVVYSDDEDDDSTEQQGPVSQEQSWISKGIKKTKSKSEIVKKLEEEAKLARKDERHQSEKEVEWLERLIAKHGDDYKAMQWDRKLNKFQQSAGDIKKRINKLRKN